MHIENADLSEMYPTAFTAVTVGIGSQVLLFSKGTSLLIQCPFVCHINGVDKWGHGEEPASSTLLFDLLNRDIKSFSVEEQGILTIDFDGQAHVKIVPEHNGFESYVVNTPTDIFPVLLPPA